MGYKMPHQLSGGEQQVNSSSKRKTFKRDPDIISADEPTGNLDPESSENLMKLLFPRLAKITEL